LLLGHLTLSSARMCLYPSGYASLALRLFHSFITLPFLAHDPKAIEVVQVILESILLRREKNMLDRDGNPIVSLPEKDV
jgi:hypothetical protein